MLLNKTSALKNGTPLPLLGQNPVRRWEELAGLDRLQKDRVKLHLGGAREHVAVVLQRLVDHVVLGDELPLLDV
tara:strand:- start:3906 stop:4127 length:222 start_codon:yes stop_codon:yes gene_type:complete